MSFSQAHQSECDPPKASGEGQSRLRRELICLVVHAKEPKTAAAARALAHFLRQVEQEMSFSKRAQADDAGLTDYSQGRVLEQATPVCIAMLDSNLPTVALCEAFEAALNEGSLSSLPPASIMTTAKQVVL